MGRAAAMAPLVKPGRRRAGSGQKKRRASLPASDSTETRAVWVPSLARALLRTREPVAEREAEGPRTVDGHRLVPLPRVRKQVSFLVGQVRTVKLQGPGVLRHTERSVPGRVAGVIVGDRIALQVLGQPVGARELVRGVQCRELPERLVTPEVEFVPGARVSLERWCAR